MLNDLKTKHNSINFEYKTSQSSICFLDTELYIKNNKLWTKHPIALKNSIRYSQVLRVKRTCSTIENFKLYCLKLKQKFIEKGYKSGFLDKHISIVEKLDGNEMLKEKVRENPKQTCIPLTLATAFVQTSVK